MTAASPDNVANLYRLARLCGVDVDVRDQSLAPETLLLVLRGLGIALESVVDASRVYDAHRREIWDWRLEPVTVSWGGSGNAVLRAPAEDSHLRIDCNVRLEDGDGHGWGVNLTDVPPFAHEVIDGEVYVAKLLPLRPLPFGYHRMFVDLAGHHTEALVISSPAQAYRREAAAGRIASLRAPAGRLSPSELRRTGYESLLEYLRSRLASGTDFRIEDAISWLRPVSGSNGVRLRYELDELIAVLCVESYRAEGSIFLRKGDDMPDEIAGSFERHGIEPLVDTAPATAAVGYPNWRRRYRAAIEDLDAAITVPAVLEVLRQHRPPPTD